MFGLVKKLLGKKEVRPATTTPAAAPSVKSKKSGETVQVSKSAPAHRVGAGSAPGKQPAGKAAPGAETVSLSLMGVVNLLPAELRPARAIGDVASVQISFPMRPILEQLTQGCVRVPFGEVRRLAPPEFFSVGPEANEKLVELPLQEILQQVQSHPYLTTSKNRKTVSVPDEVTSLFSARTSAAGPGKRPGSKGNTTSFFAREKTATPAPTAPAIRAPELAKSSLPSAAPAPAPAKQPSSPPPISVAARTPSAPAPAAPSGTEEQAPAVVDPVPPVSKPIAAPKLAAAFQPQPAKAAAPAPAATPAKAPASAPSGEVVTLPLSKICGTWPNEIQGEIVSWKLEHASVALPAEEIVASLKSGKVQVTWSRVIASLVNGVGAGKSSAHGTVVLDLPLQSVAPAFLAQRRTPGRSALPTVDASIPDLFHAGTAAEAATKPSVAAAAAAPAQTAAAAPMTTASGSATLAVPLAMVDDAWQDSLKAEIARCQVPGVKLELPVDEVNRALKTGKIEYPWRQLRAWMVPPLPPETGAEHAEKLIALPLKVIAPLFLGQVKALKSVKKGDAGSDIPDLFTAAAASPQGSEIAVGNAAASKPAASEAAAKATGDTAGAPSGFSTTQFFRKPPADLGELFGQPGKRSWTPQEIVQNTTRIRGVTGAVIAMQDGLLVAAQLPSPWKAEATAAFLPQIYSRLTQFLKELNTGELTSATLATPSGTLVVFNAGIIYFAVIGKVDETVPLAPVKMIVNELSRHSK